MTEICRNSLSDVIRHQDEIDIVATRIKPFCGSGKMGDQHPAWKATASLPNSLCRVVAIQLAENRHAITST